MVLKSTSPVQSLVTSWLNIALTLVYSLPPPILKHMGFLNRLKASSTHRSILPRLLFMKSRSGLGKPALFIFV